MIIFSIRPALFLTGLVSLILIGLLTACHNVSLPPVEQAALPTPSPSATQTVSPPPTPTTVPPTASPSPTASPTPRPTNTPTLTPTPPRPAQLLGSVMVLEYHLIGQPEARWQRTPDNFRADVARLHAAGYTPVNLIDLSQGFPDLPPGHKPVVLTFDDSDISHFRYLDNGEIDPDSAVGILYNFHQQHPATWPMKATFFVLQDVDVPTRILFGQAEVADKKLQWLIDHGFEIGSHTISHFDLAAGSDEQVQWQLAVSQRQLEARLPGYRVRSLSVPFGNYPRNETLLRQGIWDEEFYDYANTVMVAGGPSPSPHSPDFDPYRIPRIQATQENLDYWLAYFDQNPALYYVSGEPVSPPSR